MNVQSEMGNYLTYKDIHLLIRSFVASEKSLEVVTFSTNSN